MLPGYPVLANGQWVEDGGTSAAAPLAAAAFTVLDARLQAAGQPPLGPVNGLVYWLQRHHPSSLYDIVSGDNQYDRHVPGYHAHRGYDLASGVGVGVLTGSRGLSQLLDADKPLRNRAIAIVDQRRLRRRRRSP
jgi:hypothetical protein